MAILNAALESLLIQKDYFDRNPAAGKFIYREEEILPISIQFSGDIKTLEAAGFVTNSILGRIASGYATMNAIKTLTSIAQVERIELHTESHLHLNDSIPEIKADKVWNRSGDSFGGYTGKGVIIGIIDTGIDINHHTFKKPDGTTRIFKIWDQTINAPLNPPQAGETPPPAINNPAVFPNPVPLGYGVEYNAKQINDTLKYLEDTTHNPKPTVVVRHQDLKGHGTHVAGIAGGNGNQSGDCHGAYEYIGVAPDATFIVVRLWGLTGGDNGSKLKPPSNPPLARPSPNIERDAICYIVNEAKNGTAQAEHPDITIPAALSINMSFGRFTDDMDGTASLCVDMDTILNLNTNGTAIVISAGNDADEHYHATLNVPANASVKIPFEVFKDDPKSRVLAIRYTGNNLQAQLTSPAATGANMIAWIASGAANGTSATANGAGAGSLVTLSNNPNRILISIKPPTNGRNLPGTWTLELRDTSGTATQVDGFCLYGNWSDPGSLKFTDDSQYTSRSTLSEYATSFEALSIGNYSTPGWVFGGSLAKTSSRGPGFGAARPFPKPELCAPGEDIKSAGIADDRCSCCCTCCQSYYVSKGGTSMSSPHVAGAIALMLHKNPNLTHTHIRELLVAQCDPKDSGSSAEQDPGWGAGKLDAKKVVDILAQVNPPVTVPMVAMQMDHLAALQEEFLATENGPRLNGLFNRHFPEVIDLINKNKRVATKWHRIRGPVWTRLAMKAAYSPGTAVKAPYDDMNLQSAISKFLIVLKEFASESFRKDILPFEPLFRTISEGMTISQMIREIGKWPLPFSEASPFRPYPTPLEKERVFYDR